MWEQRREHSSTIRRWVIEGFSLVVKPVGNSLTNTVLLSFGRQPWPVCGYILDALQEVTDCIKSNGHGKDSDNPEKMVDNGTLVVRMRSQGEQRVALSCSVYSQRQLRVRACVEASIFSS